MVNPGIHAEMTILIRRENELEEKIAELQKHEIPLWAKRVKLAREKGMDDLAEEAKGRVRELKAKLDEAKREIESIAMQKSALRYESRRPTGNEVERAENMVEQVRLGGLVDPDRKDWESLEEESGTAFDFGEED